MAKEKTLKFDGTQYGLLLNQKFKLEDENVRAYRQIRDLNALRMSNGRKIVEIENKMRKLMGFDIVKKQEVKF